MPINADKTRSVITVDNERLGLINSRFLTPGTYTLNADGSITITVPAATAPGGPANAVQFNNAGAFGGEAAFSYNPATNTLTIDTLLASGGTFTIQLTGVPGTFMQFIEGQMNFDSNSSFQSTFINVNGTNTADDSVTALSVNGSRSAGHGGGITFAEMEVYNWLSGPVITNGATSGPQITYGGNAPLYFTADGFATAQFSVRAAETQSFVPHRLPTYTVATLPAGAVAGWKAFVSDSLAPAFGAVVAGGGAVFIPVYFDGAAWRVG